ncbi:MAG: CHAT domain-containing protein, partial [Synechococcales cyanobacterium RU_4_20]|nr:CHAT domain-containing protein [Synechococcales cyanobacterium RU_4_20]
MAKIALLVGVSQCRSGFKPLPAAARDVEALQAVLKDPERGGFEVVQVLVDPEFYALRRAISNLFTNRAEDDLLLFYFSGHGIADEYGQFYFTAADTQDGDNGRTDLATTLESRFVHQVMGRCDSERQVVILDCCHSGAFPEGMLARGAETIDFAQQLGGRGRVVLASSAAMDYSFEREGEELAIYTRYLVEGLSTGAADLDEDGQISADELHEYVKRKVQKAAPSMLPERYVFQDGEKILLAKAVMADPERRYRKCVEQYSEQGVILPTGRRILRITCRNLRLSESVAERIEAEVLQPYREYQESLLEYGEVL